MRSRVGSPPDEYTELPARARKPRRTRSRPYRGHGLRLGALPGIRAVVLGGSRARGTHRPDSDWDLGLYYRGTPTWPR